MTGFGTEERMTRNKLKNKGGSFINPRKFYMCSICGPKHLDYNEHMLRHHYRMSHKIQISSGPLPKDKSQLEDAPQRDKQSRSTKCHICGSTCSNLRRLRTHKSLHINPKFCRHKCHGCTEAFVLEGELRYHQMDCLNA